MTTVTTLDALVMRIRAEYCEMPGMQLRLNQACRLWQVDPATCAAVLEHLVQQRVLYRTPEGAYAAYPRVRSSESRGSFNDSRARTLLGA